MMLAAALAASCVTTGAGGEVAAALLRSRIAERAATCGTLRLVIAPVEVVAAALPAPDQRRWRPPASLPREGFAIRRVGATTVVTAHGTRGLVYGAGWVLRHLEVAGGTVRLRLPRPVDEAPAQPTRLTQIGYRPKNNSYDAWTLPMFARRIEDFALWGASGVQLIAPVSDDEATGPLFPAPPRETLAGIATIAHRLGLDVALYYPELGDYAKPGAVAAEMATFRRTLADLPFVDALYVPGGDPGHTAPDRLFPLVAAQVALLRARAPGAPVYISSQGFDAAGFDAFYHELDKCPAWLTGIFVGPQTRDPLAVQRARIPARYPLILYPDIAHTMHAQFPVDRWWPEFALTEGREPINPRPAAYARIFAHLAPQTVGFVTYSEGVNDDFNQFLWFRLGWDPHTGLDSVAADYARIFIGDAAAAPLPAALEANWIGDPATNAGIDATLARADAIRPAAFADWRIDALRYRAVYDALVHHRTISARARRRAALAAPDPVTARAILARPDDAVVDALLARLNALAERLWQGARLQLSVTRYGASNVERGANLDRADTDLAGRAWIEAEMEKRWPIPDRSRRAEGALYDDLGRPDAEPHLVRGLGLSRDPQGFATAIDGIADRTLADGWAPSALDYAETLYDTPLRLHYAELDPRRHYRLTITYAGEDYTLPIRLVANGRYVLQDAFRRTDNPMQVTLDVPRAATARGTLDLAWTRPPGMGGSGRGKQVAETWLIPDPLSTGATRP
ncbi:hypothetical protein [Sphingomonas beigongshangi]|uniref:hypothetical protein n=1 Tax=Sphingomonas beigongshangi TaxID=2782540 RepID=UPI00193B37A3|nr:hypothetical protein [Sphingomonas beigongshangi]